MGRKGNNKNAPQILTTTKVAEGADVLPRASVAALGEWLSTADARLAHVRELLAGGRTRPELARRAIAEAGELLSELATVAPKDAGPHAGKLAQVLGMLDRAALGRL